MSTAGARPPVVVLGLMAAGKTTLATALATHLGAPLRDSDADLERTGGRTAAEVAAEDGAAALHALELAHLHGALRPRPGEDPPVVAAAASVGDRADLAARTRGALVVWVRGAAALLADRLDAADHRPDLGDPRTVLAEQAGRRDPRFAAAADVVVEADAPTDAQLRRVLAALPPTEPAG